MKIRPGFIFIIFLILFFLPSFTLAVCDGTIFGGGSGTSGDPWQISTPTHLNNMRNCLGSGYVDKYFKLMNGVGAQMGAQMGTATNF